MAIKTLLVTGESLFLDRHQYLFRALEQHVDQVQFLPRSGEWYEATLPRFLLKGILTLQTGSRSQANAMFQKNKLAFKLKSQQAEAQIRQLDFQPDLVFQVFCTYRPFWKESTIPYVLYLDYTTALAERNWSAWATFLNETSRSQWFECEQSSYERAQHIFCMSQVVKDSLIQDYQISPENITVVGSSGDFQEPYSGSKTFGTKQILFNGSDFERKGGELVLAAFRVVKEAVPDAKLVMIGKKLGINQPGIENPGHIDSRESLHQLFLKSDLAIAPAYCDPFPTFLMEAMNFGVPCLVSNRDGMPEIVDHDLNGRVIDQLTPTEIASNIIQLLNDPTQLSQLSESAREKMRTQLNWNTISAQISQVLSKQPSDVTNSFVTN